MEAWGVEPGSARVPSRRSTGQGDFAERQRKGASSDLARSVPVRSEASGEANRRRPGTDGRAEPRPAARCPERAAGRPELVGSSREVEGGRVAPTRNLL